MQKNHAKRTALALFLLFAVTFSAQAAKIAEVIPIGHTVGIKMQAEGVLIVQLTEVQGADGTRSPAKEAGVQEGDVLRWGDLTLERATFTLQCGAREVRLSRREYDMLELLLRSQGRVVPKEQLLLKVWGYDSDAEDNNVEVYISFLRRKLTHLHSAVSIRTRRMVGYYLEVEA